jgi:hypothetical protein
LAALLTDLSKVLGPEVIAFTSLNSLVLPLEVIAFNSLAVPPVSSAS